MAEQENPYKDSDVLKEVLARKRCTLSGQDCMKRSRVRLMNKSPFYGSMLMGFRFVESAKIPTMCIGKSDVIEYNEDWARKLTDPERETELCHEIWHRINCHVERGFNWLKRCRDKKLSYYPGIANLAMDLKNDAVLARDEGRIFFPGVIRTEADGSYLLKQKGQPDYHIQDISAKTWEQIYDEIINQLRKSGGSGKGQKGKGFGEGQPLDVSSLIEGHPDNDTSSKSPQEGQKNDEEGNGEGGCPAEVPDMSEELSDIWKSQLATAVAVAKQKGNIPAGLEKYVDDVLEEKVCFRERLSRFMTQLVPFDYTWAKPSRRSQISGYYMPSTKKESFEFVCSVDTSGSCWNDITDFVGGIQQILNSFNNTTGWLMYCDCALYKVIDLTDASRDTNDWKKPEGGGGTSHKPVLDWIVENKPEVKLYICFTDTYSDLETQLKRLPDGCAKILVIPQRDDHLIEQWEDRFDDVMWMKDKAY